MNPFGCVVDWMIRLADRKDHVVEDTRELERAQESADELKQTLQRLKFELKVQGGASTWDD